MQCNINYTQVIPGNPKVLQKKNPTPPLQTQGKFIQHLVLNKSEQVWYTDTQSILKNFKSYIYF